MLPFRFVGLKFLAAIMTQKNIIIHLLLASYVIDVELSLVTFHQKLIEEQLVAKNHVAVTCQTNEKSKIFAVSLKL